MDADCVISIAYSPMTAGPKQNSENVESLLRIGKSIRNPLLETMNITWLQDAYVNAKE